MRRSLLAVTVSVGALAVTVPHGRRIQMFRDAQAKMAAKYPNDDEAQIAYAISLNTSGGSK